MSDVLEYKGYKGSIDYSSDDDLLVGKVLFIDSLILYHGNTVTEIKDNFHRAIDEYLDHCRRNNKEPNKAYTGSLNVRLGAERHRDIAQLAYRRSTSINEIICKSVDAYLHCEGVPVVVNNHTHQHQHETVVRVMHTETTAFDFNELKEVRWNAQIIQHPTNQNSRLAS